MYTCRISQLCSSNTRHHESNVHIKQQNKEKWDLSDCRSPVFFSLHTQQEFVQKRTFNQWQKITRLVLADSKSNKHFLHPWRTEKHWRTWHLAVNDLQQQYMTSESTLVNKEHQSNSTRVETKSNCTAEDWKKKSSAYCSPRFLLGLLLMQIILLRVECVLCYKRFFLFISE